MTDDHDFDQLVVFGVKSRSNGLWQATLVFQHVLSLYKRFSR